jgi:hypothetical protein
MYTKSKLHTIIDDWGKIKLKQIESEYDFWCLIDELNDDASDLYNNRCTILEAYKNGNLYGLDVNETDKMYDRRAREDNIFCKDSWYLLPCFCIKENNKAIIIWTHTRARKMGFAKQLVKLLNIEYAYNPLQNSIDFWKKCNVKYYKQIDSRKPGLII